MRKLENYVYGSWVRGEGEGQLLNDAVTGEPIARASTQGIDFAKVLDYARTKGNPALRRMTFHERGRMLKSLAQYLFDKKEVFYALSYRTGATRADSWYDIEGGIGNLFSYASLRRRFPDQPYCTDGEVHPLGKENTFAGQHLLLPKEGAAIHINAFNFPIWGMLEKIAVNFLAGVPAVVKPATITSFLTESVVREIIASEILPDGALQLLCGSAGTLLDHVASQDVVTFTGSADTGMKLKATPAILRENVPFNMEADSLNCIVLGPDVEPATTNWDLFIKEIRKEMTAKAGQRCTAIRRIFAPAAKLGAVREGLSKALSQTVIGNPALKEVRMGALAGLSQREEVRAQVQKLLHGSKLIYGNPDTLEVMDADAEAGAFLSPLLLLNETPYSTREVHEVEAFGPVSTLMPYDTLQDAVRLSKLGKGSLVCSLVTGSHDVAREFALGAGTYHGRILILNETCSRENTGHGSPLPLLVHGGPGRAGGGEEMGGTRGVRHYMQRVAVQSDPATLTAVTGAYVPGTPVSDSPVHPFRKYFEDLRVGDTVITHKRTVTEADIVNFANVSWDHFYAHTDHTALEGTPFERPVAHGYFILSAAAGLFVDPGKGPVLLNYGLEECRFLKPVYPGSTIGVRFTCKEKLPQDPRTPAPGAPPDPMDVPRGIVKWYVDVYDETGESVAVATILTMVKKRENLANL